MAKKPAASRSLPGLEEIISPKDPGAPEPAELVDTPPAGQPGPDAGGAPQLLDPTGGPYGPGDERPIIPPLGDGTEEGPPEDLTIGEILERQGKSVPTDTPPELHSGIIRDMQIGDSPLPIPDGFSPVPSTGEPIERPRQQMSYSDFVNSGYDRAALEVSKTPTPVQPLDIAADGVRFESRIRIAKAWAYDVRGLARAPDYVDRNWLAYDGPDDMRGLPASPVLRVPTAEGVTICRPGDVIVEQEVLLDENRSYREVEVWSREQFERMFIVSPRPAAAEIDG